MLKPLKPWEPIEVLMGMSVHDRVKYVRLNLPSPKKHPAQAYMSHADFARSVGSSNEKAPMRWEDETTPKRFAAAIAALTPYPPEAFGAPGEAELVRTSLGTRLQSLEETVAKADDVLRLERVLTAAIRFLASGDVEAALRVLPAEEAQ